MDIQKAASCLLLQVSSAAHIRDPCCHTEWSPGKPVEVWEMLQGLRMALGPGARWHSWQWHHPLHLHLLLLTDPTTLRGQQRSYHPILQVKRLRLWEGRQEHVQLGGTKASSEEGQGSPHAWGPIQVQEAPFQHLIPQGLLLLNIPSS